MTTTINKPLRQPVFRTDFSTTALSDWTEEQHVPDGYDAFAIRERRLVFLDAGNRLLPHIPALKNFHLQCAFDADWHINNHVFSWTVFFGYDPIRRRGLTLEIASDGRDTWLKLADADRRELARTALDMFIADDTVIRLEITAQKRVLNCRVNGQGCFTHTLPRAAVGLIALTRGSFLGELRLHELAIDTADRLAAETLWENVRIPFAPLNGMDIPVVWTVNATRRGTATTVEVVLSGGEKSRPDIPWFPYHSHYVEFLQQPYLRIESANQRVELSISDDTLVLAIPRKKYFYLLGHNNPPWPFKKTFYLKDPDKNSLLCAGYRAYANRGVNKHLEVNEAYETHYDPAAGRIVYAGRALPSEAAVIELQSPADKRICRAIPPSTRDYDRALQFAQKNHYFEETESCRFHFDLFLRGAPAHRELHIEYRLESAFFEKLSEYTPAVLAPAAADLPPDIRRRHSQIINLGRQMPGAYHLRFRLSDPAGVLYENYRAFEVLGAKTSGAAASQLPKLFSMSNEVKGQDTDVFDPWRPDCADVSHYISICTGIMPHFARERRFWELLKIYRREWFLWLGNRVMQDLSVARNRDLIEHCDYIKPCDNQHDAGFRLCARSFYHKHLMSYLYDFAVARDFRVAEIKACLDTGTIPDKALFNALVNECFYEWIDFFWQARLQELTEHKEQLRKINPRVKISSYGPAAVYGGIYKTAHTCGYAGNFKFAAAMEKFRDGYFMLEDYPHACRYSIHSGPFFLASFKAKAPTVRVYPEMYNRSGAGVPCPDAAVARAWPSYGISDRNRPLPLNASLKRVLEYVYGCVWHDGRQFQYWRDYGFHTRSWERERYAALLKVWGFVVKHAPKRPLKAPAFVCNEDCCRRHKLYYDEYPGDQHEAFGDLFNTAEECSAYAYEMSRTAGLNAGFVTDFDGLAKLSAAEVDFLVLPPLTNVSRTALNHIRRLHEQGAALLGFEEVDDLEDLFGVTAGDPGRARNISVNTKLADNPLAPLTGLTEYTDHRACIGKYRAAAAEVLLEAEIPVLFHNRTTWGRTALFNIPPTAVRRQDQFNRVAFGRASISPLINESLQLILKHISTPAVTTDAGKIIAFADQAGGRHIIIMEDAHPMPARSIRPTISLSLPDLDIKNIVCDKPVKIKTAARNRVEIALALDPDGFAIINLNNGNKQREPNLK